MLRKVLFVTGIALLLVAAVLIARDLNSPAVVSAQGGDGCDGGPCPDWIVEAWSGSGHADTTAEAFNHWNEDDPKEVPVDCAKCHSEAGYIDFLGGDGSAAGVVDKAAPIGTTVTCSACHNPAAVVLDSVTFPSGAEVSGVGPSARCMVCHQGRASGATVAAAVEKLALGPDDSSPDLRFTNIHYFAAAASLFGSQAHGGYEFEGKVYQGKFEHVEGYGFCANCHNPHTLEIRVDECSTCHTNVSTVEDLKKVRMQGSLVDYDGDGSIEESTFDELEGLQELLYQAIQAYAKDVVGTPIVYDAASYPYFFADANANGAIDEGEEGYAAWTPRLLESAYNFQMYEKDPGAFAHNSKYYVQLMYDSIENLNAGMPAPAVDLAQAHRNPAGHFDGTAEAFRHWDEEGEVPASCTKCHTAGGVPFLVKNNVNIAGAPSRSLACTTCHASMPDFATYAITDVKFPSGAVLSFGENEPANLCITCHQGRESTVSVDAAIAKVGVGDDEPSPDLGFRNVHYFAAGATLFGSEAQGVYQYVGQEYVGRNLHVPGYDTCIGCHNTHQLTVKLEECTTCHGEVEEPQDIRMMAGDYDGDGKDEGVAGEITDMHAALLTAIQAYAADTLSNPIVYDPHSYPYFFGDANANGQIDEGEEGYKGWSPRLLRAAYNYQYVAKDPGAFAHNSKYIVQVLYDSLKDIGGDAAVAGMTRP